MSFFKCEQKREQPPPFPPEEMRKTWQGMFLAGKTLPELTKDELVEILSSPNNSVTMYQLIEAEIIRRFRGGM